MKPSTESEIVDRVHEVKGKIKEEMGQLTINPGKDQKKIAQLQKVIALVHKNGSRNKLEI
jgi:hypothetical protein